MPTQSITGAAASSYRAAVPIDCLLSGINNEPGQSCDLDKYRKRRVRWSMPRHAARSTNSPVMRRVTREAEANQQKLTPEFLQISFMKAISNNTKLYFGDKLPSMLLELHQILPAVNSRCCRVMRGTACPTSNSSAIMRKLHQNLPAVWRGWAHTSGRCPNDHTPVTTVQLPKKLSCLQLSLQGMTPCQD